MAAYPEGSTTTLAPQPLALALPRAGALVLGAFGAAIFAGATLVFLIQPIAARMVLPLFGGSQAVWTTSMLFFQAVLLAGYGYSHLAARFLRRAPLVHAVLLALPFLLLPIGGHLAAPPDGFPVSLWLLGVLAVSVGAPFLMVTTASPMLQHWFSRTGHRAAADPYFLYAAGNAGSLLALVAYPLLVEPRLTLDAQARLWTAGYAVFVALSLVCLLLLARHRSVEPARAATRATSPRAVVAHEAPLGALRLRPLEPPTRVDQLDLDRHRVGAAPLGGAARGLPADVHRRLLARLGDRGSARVGAPPGAGRGGAAQPAERARRLSAADRPLGRAPPADAPLRRHTRARAARRRAAARRPPDGVLRPALGRGVLGGVFNALLAPQLFDSVLEYPLALVLALLLRPSAARSRRWTFRFAWTADFLLPFLVFVCTIAAIAASSWGDETPEPGGVVTSGILVAGAAARFSFARNRLRFAVGFTLFAAVVAFGQPTLHSERTFYGVLRVVEGPKGEHYLQHGTTLHGVESFARGRVGEPLSYYTRSGPIGDVFRLYQAEEPFGRVGLVGLGVGSLAAYGRAGQTFEFYEIDPAVIEIANDARWFTFLRDSRARVSTVAGDARRSLERAPRGANDLLVVDAFSSDSIPVHLLTREAVQLYLGTVRTEGLIAFHVSNRHLRLAPVVAGIADSLGLAAAHRFDLVTADAAERGAATSHWIVVARSPERLRPCSQRTGSRSAPTRASASGRTTSRTSSVRSTGPARRTERPGGAPPPAVAPRSPPRARDRSALR